ncbi:hypothetical protein [Gryllotalpicola kribbensis]
MTTLEERLTAVILAEPDVRTIYPTRPAFGEIGSRLGIAEIGASGESPKVAVVESEDGTAVSISIGVTGQRPATSVCRNVHKIIADELAPVAGPRPLSISIKVASVG